MATTDVSSAGYALLGRLNDLESSVADVVAHQANRWGTIVQRIRWVVRKLATGLGELVVGTVMLVFESMMRFEFIYQFVIFGILALVVREFVLWFVVKLLNDIKLVTDIINVFMWAFEAIVNVAISAIDVIGTIVNGIVKVVNDASKFFTGHSATHFNFPLKKWIPMKTLTYNEVRTALSGLPPTCVHFDSMPKILAWTLKLVLHEHTCPVTRFVYPIPWLYAATVGFLGWSYYGSADPFLFDNQANCAASGSGTGANPWEYACAALGLGYILLELCLPIMFVDIILTNLMPPILEILELGTYLVEVAVIDSVEVAAALITALV